MKNREIEGVVLSLHNGSVLPLAAVKHPVLARVLQARAAQCRGREFGTGPKFNFNTHEEHDEYSQGSEYTDRYNDNGYSENDERH